MIEVFNTVAPVFVLILLGFAGGRSGLFAEGSAGGLSMFVFGFAVPALLFRAMVSFGLPPSPPWKLWAAFFGAVASIWVIAIVLSRKVPELGGAGGASAALGAAFGNTVMLGLPLGVAHYGDAALLPMALILSIHLPLQWFAATLLAQASGAARGSGGMGLVRALGRDIAFNPIVLALVAGMAWNFTGLGLAPVPAKVIGMLGDAAVPAALFALGLSLSRFGLKGNRAAVATLLALKLAVMPMIAAVLALQVLGLPPVEAGIVILFAALPAGANAFIFAERQGHGEAAVSGAIAAGTALSVVSLSVVLALLG